MKVTIDIWENKIHFFMELLKSLDFIKSEPELEEGLSETHKAILSERMNKSTNDPSRLVALDDAFEVN